MGEATLKQVPAADAVGMVLGHDLTRIVPGQSKGVQFRRGHVIRSEDVAMLLSMGKENIYVLEIPPGYVHEEEAALRIARAAAGRGLELTEPREGKVEFRAVHAGLLRVDVARLERLNSIGEIQFVTARDRTGVTAGQVVAGTRVTPLLVAEGEIAAGERLAAADHASAGPLVQVLPFRPLRAAIIVTGSEVYKGRIQDRFGPVVQAKLEALGATVIRTSKSLDDREMIAGEIRAARAAGAELICVTGGMSVDPDDATPGGIKRAGAHVVTYGAPVLPGSMFLMAYLEGVPVMGLPGAVMHDPVTLFDLVLVRVLVGEVLTKADFVQMGHGGLLRRC